MAIPVPIPPGALPVTDQENDRVEDFVGKLAQLLKSGSSGVAFGPKQTVVPSTIPNGTNPTSLVSLELSQESQQLFYRAMGFAVLQSMGKIPLGLNVEASSYEPTTSSDVFDILPEMQYNWENRPAKTLFIFSGSFYIPKGAGMEICLMYDGNLLGHTFRRSMSNDNDIVATLSTQHVVESNDKTHELVVMWRAISGAVSGVDIQRSLSVLESF